MGNNGAGQGLQTKGGLGKSMERMGKKEVREECIPLRTNPLLNYGFYITMCMNIGLLAVTNRCKKLLEGTEKVGIQNSLLST